MIFPSDTQTLAASVAFVDGRGNPARVDGIPAWELTGDNIGSVEPSADGMSAVVTLNGSLGIAQVAVRADADLDAGETRELVITGELEIIAAEAVGGTVTFTVV